jgi:molybdopterin biosynthesis enzyme
MAQANGLMIVPEDKPAIEVGEKVQVQMLDWNEET